ncbi:hypothetical protein ACXC9Q_17630 [Kribbella sp. CWNU-51]
MRADRRRLAVVSAGFDEAVAATVNPIPATTTRIGKITWAGVSNTPATRPSTPTKPHNVLHTSL